MKQKILRLFALIFTLYAFTAQSQNIQKVDSLLNQFKIEKNDTIKIELLLDISQGYQSIDIKKAENFALEAIELANKIAYKKGVADSYLKLGINYLIDGEFLKSTENIESSLKIYEELGDMKGQSDCFITMGTILTRQGKYTNAIEDLNKSINLKEAIGDKEGVSSCYRNLGIVKANQSDYTNSIRYFEKSLAIEEAFGNKKNISDCLSNMGVIYNYQGNHIKSIEYQEKALKVVQEIGDKLSISARLINLGASYDDLSEYDKALKCYDEALIIKLEFGDKTGVSSCYNNIGEVYRDKGEYAKSIEYYEKSLHIDTELNDKSGIAICLLNIGNVHFQLGDYGKALNYYNNALSTAEQVNEKRIMANVLNSIGEVLLKQMEYEKAIVNFERASVFSNEMGDESEIAKSAYFMGEIYIYQGKFDKAIDYFNDALKLHAQLSEKGNASMDYIKIGEAYFLSGNQSKSIEYCLMGYNIAKDLGLKEEIRNASHILSNTYALKKNFRKAYEYSVIFRQAHDSIFTLESQKQIHTIENRFEIERNLQEIELQKAKLAKQDVEIKQQQYKQNVLLIGLLAVLVAVVIFIVVIARIRKAKNIILSQKGQIEDANEELNQVNEELIVTIETVNLQKQLIEKTNREITDSIQYARYIQNAILPKNEIFTKSFKDHFVLFKPKDIVSGDFYWTTELEGVTIIAAADCTGHGVPGAFMSMLGISFLNDIINKEYITHTGVILRHLRKDVIKALHQTGELGEQRDGLDIALCSIDFKTMALQFSGAHLPLYIIRKKNKTGIEGAIVTELGDYIMYEIKGNKMPIALYEKMDQFDMAEITIQKGDSLYMFSDGYSDQFGGPDGKRLQYKPFRQLLLENVEKPMSEQKKILEIAFYEWKQEYEQIDDVMVLGFLV